MDTISASAAAVTGARHVRAGRNGQDAAASWVGRAGETGARVGADHLRPAGAIVVCDGCGSGASSEVGARLGAQLVIASLARRLAAGMSPADPSLWRGMRAEVVAALGRVVEVMPDPAQAIHECFLFTIVAAAVGAGEACVWAVGDGAYLIDDRVRVLGPFADNQPPYLAYDLLGMPAVAHVETAPACTGTGTIVVATDGIAEVGLETIDHAAIDRALRHPDALRRQLALLARGTERIDWAAERVARTPAALQDDGAVAIARWA